MLDELDGFRKAITSITFRVRQITGDLHCSGCGASRRVFGEMIYPFMGEIDFNKAVQDIAASAPFVVCDLECVQCRANFKVIRYAGPNGLALVVLADTAGGLSTPHTPKGVAYYLDQAEKSHSLGANSAALAMFRSALEHLLFEQGFEKGMLHQKIVALEAAVGAGTAPKWATDLDTEYLNVLKELGNGSIHTNGGDVSKQGAADAHLIALVKTTFAALLQIVYEIPHQKQANLRALKAKASLMK